MAREKNPSDSNDKHITQDGTKILPSSIISAMTPSSLSSNLMDMADFWKKARYFFAEKPANLRDLFYRAAAVVSILTSIVFVGKVVISGFWNEILLVGILSLCLSGITLSIWADFSEMALVVKKTEKRFEDYYERLKQTLIELDKQKRLDFENLDEKVIEYLHEMGAINEEMMRAKAVASRVYAFRRRLDATSDKMTICQTHFKEMIDNLFLYFVKKMIVDADCNDAQKLVEALQRRSQQTFVPLSELKDQLEKSLRETQEYVGRASTIISALHIAVGHTDKKFNFWVEKLVEFSSATQEDMNLIVDPTAVFDAQKKLATEKRKITLGIIRTGYERRLRKQISFLTDPDGLKRENLRSCQLVILDELMCALHEKEERAALEGGSADAGTMEPEKRKSIPKELLTAKIAQNLNVNANEILVSHQLPTDGTSGNISISNISELDTFANVFYSVEGSPPALIINVQMVKPKYQGQGIMTLVYGYLALLYGANQIYVTEAKDDAISFFDSLKAKGYLKSVHVLDSNAGASIDREKFEELFDEKFEPSQEEKSGDERQATSDESKPEAPDMAGTKGTGFTDSGQVTAEITVLSNNVTPKHMVELPVIKASELNEQGREQAVDCFMQWLEYSEAPDVKHRAAIEMFIYQLLDNVRTELSDLYLVLSEDFAGIEGWVDLDAGVYSMMEIAPWNRRETDGDRKYKGVGSELRVLAIRELLERYGNTLYDEENIGRVLALGHRNPPSPDIFDHFDTDRRTVELYLKEQREGREELIRRYGFLGLETISQESMPLGSVSVGDDTNPLILEHIDNGVAVEVNERTEVVKEIRCDKTSPRAPPVEDRFRINGTFDKIRMAKDPLVLENILAIKRNFRNLTPKEKTELIHIVQNISLSLLLGKVIVGEKAGIKNGRVVTLEVPTHVRTGFNKKKHGLDPTVWIGEVLLYRLSAEQLAHLLLEECQHILKPPQKVGGEWINLHGKISENSDARTVIEHDQELIFSMDLSPTTESELASIYTMALEPTGADKPEAPDMSKPRWEWERDLKTGKRRRKIQKIKRLETFYEDRRKEIEESKKSKKQRKKPEAPDMARYREDGPIRMGRFSRMDYGGLSPNRRTELSLENMEEAAWQLYQETGQLPRLREIATRLDLTLDALKERRRELNRTRRELGLRAVYFPKEEENQKFANRESANLETIIDSWQFDEVFTLYENKDRSHNVWKQSYTFKNAFFRAKIIKFLEEVARNVRKPGRGDNPLEDTLDQWFGKYDDPMVIEHGQNKARRIMNVIAEKGFDFVLKNFPAQAEYILSIMQANDFTSTTRIRCAYALKPEIIGNFRLLITRGFPELKMDIRDFTLWWRDYREGQEDEDVGIANVRYKFKKYRPELYYKWLKAQNGELNEEEKQALREEFASTEWEGDIEWMRLAGGLNMEVAPYFEESLGIMIAKSFSCDEFELEPMDVNFELPSKDTNEVLDYTIQYVRHHFMRRFPEVYALWFSSEYDPVTLEEAMCVRETIVGLTDRIFQKWGAPLHLLKRGGVETSTRRAIEIFMEAFSTTHIDLERRDFQFSWGSREESIENIRFKLSRYNPELYEEWQRIGTDGGTIDEEEALRKKLRKIGKTTLDKWQASVAGHKGTCPWFKGSLPCVVAESFKTEKFDLDELDIYNSWKTEQDGIDSVRQKFKRIFPELYQDYMRLEGDPSNEELCQDLKARFETIRFKDVRNRGLKHSTNIAAAPFFEGNFNTVIRKSFPALFPEAIDKPEAPDMAREKRSEETVDDVLCELIEFLKKYGIKRGKELQSIIEKLNLSPESRFICGATSPATNVLDEYIQGLDAERIAAKLSEDNLYSETVARNTFLEMGRTAYELVANCIKVGEGGVILIEVEKLDDDVLFRITARDLGPGIDNVEDARKKSFTEAYRSKGRGHGFKSIASEWAPFRKGKVAYKTKVKTWTLNPRTGEFEVTGENNIDKGVHITLEVTKKQLSGETEKPEAPDMAREKTIDDAEKSLIEQVILETRKTCNGLGACTTHSLELARRLIKEGKDARVIKHVSRTHWWVEVDQYVIDPFPEGVDENYTNVVRKAGNEMFVITEKNSKIANTLYIGVQDEGKTQEARKNAADDAEFYGEWTEMISRPLRERILYLYMNSATKNEIDNDWLVMFLREKFEDAKTNLARAEENARYAKQFSETKPEAPDMAREKKNTANMSLPEAYAFLCGFFSGAHLNDLVYSQKLAIELTEHPIDNILITGAGLSCLPFLLALTGKTVTFVNLDYTMSISMQQIADDVNKELARIGIEENIAIQTITGEIGALNLTEYGLNPHSFDLVTFIDMIGVVPKGNPSTWLSKARELLKQEGYLVIDERDGWMAISEHFPQYEVLSEGRYFMGDYEGIHSQNRFYRVRNSNAKLLDEHLPHGRICPVSGHYPAVPARQGVHPEAVPEENQPLSQNEWDRKIRLETQLFKDGSVFKSDSHRDLLESTLKDERLRRIRAFKQVVKDIFAPLQTHEGDITPELIQDLFSQGSAQFHRKLADYKVTDLQYLLTRTNGLIDEDDYARGILSPGSEQCDTVSAVIVEALSDILSPERLKVIHGVWYDAAKDVWETHFWVRIDDKIDACFTYDQFDLTFWGRVLVFRPEDIFKERGLFELEEEPGKFFKKDDKAQMLARTKRLIKAFDEADTDQKLNALVPLTLKMADSNFLDMEQLVAWLELSTANHSRFEYVLSRLGVWGEPSIAAPEYRKGARTFVPIKMGTKFNDLYDVFKNDTRFSWGEGKDKMEAVIRYDGYRTIEIIPTEETKAAHPELELLDRPADSVLVPAFGAFGNIVIEILRVENEYALWIEEIQPSIGFRDIKPLAKRQKFRDWNAAAVDYIVKAACKAGFRTIYASTETEIRQKFNNLNQGNVRENYHRPFRDTWEKVDIALGRRQTKLWQKKSYTLLETVVNAINNAKTNEELNGTVPAVIDGVDAGEFTFKEFVAALNEVVRDHIAFARWIYVMNRMGLSLKNSFPAAERKGERLFMSIGQGAKFGELEKLLSRNIRFAWGEGEKRVEALVLYSPDEKVLKIFPNRETILADPELKKLDTEADDAYVPDEGLFGVIRIQELVAGEEPTLYIDEVQPSIGFRQIKPLERREKYRDWNKAAIEHIASLARQAGFRTCYASTTDEIRQRYSNEKKINQGNLKENYKRPFKDKWDKADAVIGRRQTKLWCRDIQAVPDHAAQVEGFLTERAKAVDKLDYRYVRFSNKHDLYDYLGLTEDSREETNSMQYYINHFFDVLTDSLINAYVTRTTENGHEYVSLCFKMRSGDGHGLETIEYLYVDNKYVAHGISTVQDHDGRKQVILEMGIDEVSYKGSGHMQVFFNTRQHLSREIFRPVAFTVPTRQISSWDAFFFYVRKGYLPYDAEARSIITEKFLVPWLKDRDFRINDPGEVFGEDFLDECGDFFVLYLEEPSPVEAVEEKPEAPDMTREKKPIVPADKPHEEFTAVKDPTSGDLTCILNLSSDEKGPLGQIILRVEKEGIVLYSCGGLDVKIQGEGYGAMLLLRGFAHAFQAAQKNGMDPKWAYVYATIAEDRDLEAIESLNGFLSKLGFIDEYEVDIWQDKHYADLVPLIRKYPGATELEQEHWFSNLKDLVGTYNERLGATLGVIKSRPEAEITKINEKPDIQKVLRNLADTQQLSQGLVEMMLSVTFNRKLVLAFDSDIASCSSGNPLGLFEMLEKLKEDPRYSKILKNLVIIKAPSAELASKLEGYTDKKDTEVFMFAMKGARNKLKLLEPKVRSVYIDEKDFPMSSYYPLAEVVAISLAQLFEDTIPEKTLTTALSYGSGEIALEDMNIESVTRDSNVLIFKLLPDAEPCDTGDLLKRYANIKRFLKAA